MWIPVLTIYSVIPESIVEAFIERIWVSKDEFRWYLRTGNNADGEFDPDDHIKIGAFTLTIDDAKKYIYSFSTRRRVYKWADLNVSVWIWNDWRYVPMAAQAAINEKR